MLAQRRMVDIIHDNSRAAAQTKSVDALLSNPRFTTQRKNIDTAFDVAEQGADIEGSLQSGVTQRIEASAKPNNTGLPDDLKSGIESLSGMSMDNVRVHYNSSQPAQLNALAYAQGFDIHIAPGQEKHLPHEAWHVVQQAQGRVQPTMQMKNVQVNDAAELEHEADVMAEHASKRGKDADTVTSIAAKSLTMPAARPTQLKSKFNGISLKKKGAETPIATLSSVFGKYFAAASLAEAYNIFGTLVLPSDFKGSWDKPKTVEASIDPASKSNADGNNRNNGVIGPYGRFGVIERAIFQRPNSGTSYDGGHLVEHTLMEGQDADVHGNIAPQEAKHFNQSLMRGWESIPEHLMHYKSFTYTVGVSYEGSNYQRTGNQLVNAGVINPNLLPKLPTTGPTTAANLNGESVTFERWIPNKWEAKIDAGNGSVLPSFPVTYGKHWNNVFPTHQDGQDEVEDNTVKSVNTGPSLTRRNSGTLAGWISDVSSVPGAKAVLVGGKQIIEAHFYQPEPQDILDQPFATKTPSGATPKALPNATKKVKTLKLSVSLSKLKQDLDEVECYKSISPLRKKANTTVDADGKKKSTGNAHFREIGLLTREGGVAFIRQIQNIPTLDASSLAVAAARSSNMSTSQRQKFALLGLDPKLLP